MDKLVDVFVGFLIAYGAVFLIVFGIAVVIIIFAMKYIFKAHKDTERGKR